MRVFLDRNIISRAVILEPAVQMKEIVFGGVAQELPISGWRRKPLRHGDVAWIENEINSMPTLARLGKDGCVEFFESQETTFEGWSASTGARGENGDLLSKVPIKRVPTAVDRSYFASQSLAQVASRQKVINFCKFLRSIDVSRLERIPEIWQKLPREMQFNLLNLERFKKLTSALPTERHWPDVLHLWTAETHKADYFLTLDRKFERALTMTAKINLVTSVCSPSKFLDDMGVKDLDPIPFEHSKFYTIFDFVD